MLLAATPLIKKKCIFAQLMSHVVFSSMEERHLCCVGNSKRNLNTATCQNILNSDFSEDLLNQKYIAPFQSFTVELPNNFLCNNIMLRLVMRLQNLL